MVESTFHTIGMTTVQIPAPTYLVICAENTETPSRRDLRYFPVSVYIHKHMYQHACTLAKTKTHINKNLNQGVNIDSKSILK